MVEITESCIDPNQLVDKVASPEAGAISTFIGVTRNFTGPHKVNYLFYEAYHSMAIKQMEKLTHMVKEKFPVLKVAITHRIGKVEIGEASVVIAVSSSHRGEAIEACHFAIDHLKEIVPIWKKEFMTDDSKKWIANRPDIHN